MSIMVSVVRPRLLPNLADVEKVQEAQGATRMTRSAGKLKCDNGLSLSQYSAFYHKAISNCEVL